MLRVTLTATPSLNKLVHGRWQMLNWKKKYKRELNGYEHVIGKAKNKRYIMLERYGSRILDYDNLVGGFKPLIDALKELHIIVDDNPQWVAFGHISQMRCERGGEKTILYVSDTSRFFL